MKLKEESENVGLKFNIQKTKIMASGPITSWEIDGETVETVFPHLFPMKWWDWMGKQWKQCQTLFWGALKSLQMVIAAMKLEDAYSLEGKLRPT